jgi:hypothetical protein
VTGSWINEAETEFIWIREYESAEDAKVKDDLFYNSPEWKAIAHEAIALLAKTNVTVMTSASLAPREG